MKRSEMLAKIKKILLSSPNSNNLEEVILSTIEKAGMLPPTAKFLPKQFFRTRGEFGFDANEWEPEDNKVIKPFSRGCKVQWKDEDIHTAIMTVLYRRKDKVRVDFGPKLLPIKDLKLAED